MRVSSLHVPRKIRISSQLSQLRGLRPLRVTLLRSENMTEARTYAWLFYATSMVSFEQEPAKHISIVAAADAINHAIPTQKEISQSFKWLQEKELIRKVGKRALLTDTGKELIEQIENKPGGVMKVWDRITKSLKRMGADDSVSVNCNTMKAEPISRGNEG